MNKFIGLRLLLCCFAALMLTLQAAAQTQAGAIKAVKVSGEVSRLDAAGVKSPVTEGQPLIETDTVVTGEDAGLVLVFMNGSSVKVGANSRLAIEEFKMDPLAENIAVASLKNEPSVSKTRLNLAYGEMVGNVKKLNTDRGSTFDVKTPVGAAGIRGTTFRILLRFEANGQVSFQLSTAEGRIVFAGTTQVAGTGTTTEAGAAVEVSEGQEVAAVAQVNTVTGAVTAVQVTSVQPISAAATQAITTAVTQAIEQAVQATTFTPAEQQQAAQQTPTPPPATPSEPSGEKQAEAPKETPPATTPPTVIDSSTRSGSG